MTTTVPGIYAALVKAAQDLPDIPKDGVLKFGDSSYNFRRIDDIKKVLRALLLPAGVLYVPRVISTRHELQVAAEPLNMVQVHPESSLVVTEAREVRDGRIPTTRSWAEVEYELRFILASDGSELTATAAALAYDTNSDKSIGKATTAAIKRILVEVFQITDHSDGDLEEADPDARNRARTTDSLEGGDRGQQQRQAAATAAVSGTTRRSGPQRSTPKPEPVVDPSTGEVQDQQPEPQEAPEPNNLDKQKARIRIAVGALGYDPAQVNAIASEVTGVAERSEWITKVTLVKKLADELEKRVNDGAGVQQFTGTES